MSLKSALLVFLVTVQVAVAEEQTTGRFGSALNFRQKPLRAKALEAYGRRPVSIECWFKLPEEKKFRYNVLLSHLPESHPHHWEIYTTPLQGHLTLRVGPKLLETFHRVTDGEWHFLHVTLAEKHAAVAVDGRGVGRTILASPQQQPRAKSGELFVGSELKDPKAKEHAGWLDDLRISGTVRESTVVPRAEMKADERTVGLWRFDKLTGNRAVDASANSNSLAYSPGIAAAWTPRSSTRPDAADWEKETDDHWLDGRFAEMDKGRFLGCSMSAPATAGNKRGPFAAKGLTIRLGEDGEAAVLFDKARLQLCAGWTGDWLKISDRRFGLIRHPQPAGEMMFSLPSAPGWKSPSGSPPRLKPHTPLPRDWGHFDGLSRRGKRTIIRYTVGKSEVLDMPWAERINGKLLIRRTLSVSPSTEMLQLPLIAAPKCGVGNAGESHVVGFAMRGKEVPGVVMPTHPHASLHSTGTQVLLRIAARQESMRVTFWYARASQDDWLARRIPLPAVDRRIAPLDLLPGNGPARWPNPIFTVGKLGDGKSGFAVDTLTLPFQNPYKSIFYVTGVGFLPNNRIAICTIYGDVWLVDGITDDLRKLRWKRFAAGLYQPMGLAIHKGEIVVLERGQLTKLHDENGDDEADFYESLYHGWQTAGAGHAYDTGLKLAPCGDFFFFKGQAPNRDCTESGCLLRVYTQVKRHAVFATGFRHPIGTGMSPTGVVTGADQQGNWMPATRIDRYQMGGFYGDMRTHHREVPPQTYDKPICWLPQYVDNSAGGQIWVPENTWGPYAGKTLHLSWGRCRLFHLMHEDVDGQWQGGVVPLPCDTFPAGSLTGAFHPDDGHLYVVGLHGWQTAGEADGCLQRVRYTGLTVPQPVSLKTEPKGIAIEFSSAIDETSVTNKAFAVERWNYRYAESYGSDHWSVANPDRQGHDRVKVLSSQLSGDGKTVHLELDEFGPVMQMKVAYRLKSKDGKPAVNTIHHTVHNVGE